jgi:small subunit ribosomal protein S9
MVRKKDNLISTGKRKRSIARALIKPGEGKFTVNGQEPLAYFGNHPILLKKIMAALELTGNIGKKDISVNVCGGGLSGQADAVAHAIAKSLSKAKEASRKTLKAAGMLSRDSRIKESKKYGRKKARKRFQFSKR